MAMPSDAKSKIEEILKANEKVAEIIKNLSNSSNYGAEVKKQLASGQFQLTGTKSYLPSLPSFTSSAPKAPAPPTPQEYIQQIHDKLSQFGSIVLNYATTEPGKGEAQRSVQTNIDDKDRNYNKKLAGMLHRAVSLTNLLAQLADKSLDTQMLVDAKALYDNTRSVSLYTSAQYTTLFNKVAKALLADLDTLISKIKGNNYLEFLVTESNKIENYKKALVNKDTILADLTAVFKTQGDEHSGTIERVSVTLDGFNDVYDYMHNYAVEYNKLKSDNENDKEKKERVIEIIKSYIIYTMIPFETTLKAILGVTPVIAFKNIIDTSLNINKIKELLKTGWVNGVKFSNVKTAMEDYLRKVRLVAAEGAMAAVPVAGTGDGRATKMLKQAEEAGTATSMTKNAEEGAATPGGGSSSSTTSGDVGSTGGNSVDKLQGYVTQLTELLVKAREDNNAVNDTPTNIDNYDTVVGDRVGAITDALTTATSSLTEAQGIANGTTDNRITEMQSIITQIQDIETGAKKIFETKMAAKAAAANAAGRDRSDGFNENLDVNYNVNNSSNAAAADGRSKTAKQMNTLQKATAAAAATTQQNRTGSNGNNAARGDNSNHDELVGDSNLHYPEVNIRESRNGNTLERKNRPEVPHIGGRRTRRRNRKSSKRTTRRQLTS